MTVGEEWETITYGIDDGADNPPTYRQRWVGVDPPGPLGSGITYLATHFEWKLADDEVWEKTIYAWRLA